MARYLLKRVIQIIPVLLILTFIIFCLVYVAGDPVALMLPPEAGEEAKAALREALGLNKPFLEQFFIYLGNLLRGNFGVSYQYNQDALSLVLERMPYSLQLASVSLLASVVIGIVLGIAAAQFRNTPFDLLVNGFAALGQAMPGFWVAIMLILVFAVNLHVLPVSGADSWKSLVLPAATLTLLTSAKIIPLIRSNMIEVMQQDYIRTARSKGLSRGKVIFKHAFKNTLVPVITIIAMQLPTLIGGALITETIFAWPGLGMLIYRGVANLDMTVVQAGVMAVAVITILANLISDVAYCLIDPTIKYQ
jgi:peptide/nickel transport system permease protein